ncbi:MAG: PhnD/SsuA/transferrin family substrate-binding protein [Methylococcales bacterium]
MKNLLKSIVLTALFGLFSFSCAALESNPITFVAVALDPETQQADERLRQYFQARLRLDFEIRDLEYSAAIQALKSWQAAEQGPVMARITPYVYVVAEMLGANLEILASYRSKASGNNLYHAYFVARRSQFAGRDLDEFVQNLRQRPIPARFIYHNKFSTSSYFLPSLYFSEKGIFSVAGQDKNDRSFITIHAEHPDEAQGSSDLVRMVKAGQADFAAIWDGTKSKFEDDSELAFFQLPTPLPNDLLVISRSTDPTLKDKLSDAIGALNTQDIDVGDFWTWINFNEIPNARSALAMLRWKARTVPKPVPIQVRKAYSKGDDLDEVFVEAAKQAIRLSGTEFVLFDEDFHKHFDVLWTLRKTHENALEITSEFVDSGIPPQSFHITFETGNPESLVYRIGFEITNRMHRIRTIWPFDDIHPRVIRDVDFDLPEGQVMKGQKVTWKDLSNNDFSVDAAFDVEIAKTDFSSFEFTERGFAKRSFGPQFDFDPMSNVAYRIFLVRPQQDTLLIKVLSATLIVLFSLSAVWAVYSVWRKPAPRS